eukprot:4698003-Amphidinium_carterae.1
MVYGHKSLGHDVGHILGRDLCYNLGHYPGTSTAHVVQVEVSARVSKKGPDHKRPMGRSEADRKFGP